MYAALTRVIEGLTKLAAIAGGIALLVVTVLICVSITGRALSDFGLGPVNGDYELVQMGVGFAIFAFLPWCLYKRGNATVDLFAASFPPTLLRVIDLVSSLLALGIAVILTWQLWAGLSDKKAYLETSFILQFPDWFGPVFGLTGGFQLWIGYALAMFGASIFVLTAAYCVIRSIRTVMYHRDVPLEGAHL